MGVLAGGFPPWDPALLALVSLLQAQQQHLASLPPGGEKRMVALKDMADGSGNKYAHTAELLRKVFPVGPTRGRREAPASLDSLSCVMAGDQRSLGTRRRAG